MTIPVKKLQPLNVCGFEDCQFRTNFSFHSEKFSKLTLILGPTQKLLGDKQMHSRVECLGILLLRHSELSQQHKKSKISVLQRHPAACRHQQKRQRAPFSELGTNWPGSAAAAELLENWTKLTLMNPLDHLTTLYQHSSSSSELVLTFSIYYAL